MSMMEEAVLIDVAADATCTDLGLPLGGPGEKEIVCKGCVHQHANGAKKKQASSA
jgi:hypothetical protein